MVRSSKPRHATFPSETENQLEVEERGVCTLGKGRLVSGALASKKKGQLGIPVGRGVEGARKLVRPVEC